MVGATSIIALYHEPLNKNFADGISDPHWPVASRDTHTGYTFLIAVKSTIPDINHTT